MSEYREKRRENFSYKGYVDISAVEGLGMVSLRADLSSPELAAALDALFAARMPKMGEIVVADQAGDMRLAWMSPDELFIISDYAKAEGICADLNEKLESSHALSFNMSDARVCFQLDGSDCAEVIAKLCPVDMSWQAFGMGQIRRTRLAQIPTAFWKESETCFRLICFRSQAQYAFDVLCHASDPQSKVF